MNDWSIAEQVEHVRERIAGACERSGRHPDEVRLLAVSKTHGPERVEEAREAGLTLFGENRVQEAQAKIPRCPPGIEWHLIGHLQRNKARLAVHLFDTIHSLDSERIIDAVAQAAEAEGKRLPVLLEVNVSGEAAKFGWSPDDVPGAIEQVNHSSCLELQGLMTMPPIAEDPEKVRGYFTGLRNLRDRWEQETGTPLPELSMGMSHDFEVAVEEGATIVRLGSVLFGRRGTPWKPSN